MRFEHLMVLQVAAVVVACGVPPAAAQVAPAAGNTTQADTPSIKVGGVTFFGDYTMVQQPNVIDADGNAVTGNAFNVGRAYLNVTGSVS